MRKLASIQTISSVRPIRGADSIEKVTTLGWEVVVKKGEFKKGSKCLYLEVDSFLPPRMEWDFLKDSSSKRMLVGGKNVEGYRLRTIKLRGEVSQGLCLPLDLFPELSNKNVGDDVSDLLGVIKYEPPISAKLSGLVKGDFPSFIPRTDETRVQAMPKVLKEFGDKLFYVTEKLDGCSLTIYVNEGELNVCSRNLNLAKPIKNPSWKNKILDYNKRIFGGKNRIINSILRRFDIRKESKNSLWEYVENMKPSIIKKIGELGYALQGEMIGEGIQKNKYGIKGHTVKWFNVYDIRRQKYLNHRDFVRTIKMLGLRTVPIIMDSYKLRKKVATLVELSKRMSLVNPNVMAEGIVLRPLKEGVYKGNRLSFKVINPEFLLEHKQ